MRQIGPFLCWKLFTGGYWAGFRPIFWPNSPIFLTLQPYNSIFWTPTHLFNIKMSSPYPQLSLGNFGLLARLRLAPRQVFFGPDCPKFLFWEPRIVLLGPKSQFFNFFWPKNGPKTWSGASRAMLSTQKVPIYLILTTFGDEITFGHIAQW